MSQIKFSDYKPLVLEISEVLKMRLMGSSLGSELLDIFSTSALTSCFQPIIDVKKRQVCGFEALIRGPQNSALHYPLNLFSVAADHECLYEMDALARVASIKSFSEQLEHVQDAYLFLNISVDSVLNCSHENGMTLKALEAFGIAPNQVVIEITELQPVEDFNGFVKAINHYRKLGFKVAIDDLGSGYNGLRIWSEIHPDFVKIDRHFVTDIYKDADKKRFMETLVSLAKGLKTKIVAEGIESELELKTLEALGVDYVQGFLFKKPASNISTQINYQWPVAVQQVALGKYETVTSVISSDVFVSSNMLVADVVEQFLQQPELDFYPVVDDGRVLGMVWRRDLMDVLARKYGQELHGRKTIDRLMDSQPIVVESTLSVVVLSRMITDYNGQGHGDAFIVIKEGRYLGCGRFKDLLRKITDLKVESAQYANPLSGLPGNVPIQNMITQYLEHQKAFAVLYIDVDHFKPYNDYYSFEQGDGVIRMIAEILKDQLSADEIANDRGFISHIGGDDFMMLLAEDCDYEVICQEILHEFCDRISQFYLQEDRERGGILGLDRHLEHRFFPMMTLSLGVLLVKPGIFDHTQKLSSCVTKAKKGAKAAGGNTYFVVDSATLM